jgi:hypothetical protein
MQFIDMFTSMVSVVEDPHQLHRKLVDLAPMHLKKGVKGDLMPHMYRVLNSVLTKVLGTLYIEKFKESWKWIWVFLTASMQQSLTDASASSQVINLIFFVSVLCYAQVCILCMQRCQRITTCLLLFFVRAFCY